MFATGAGEIAERVTSLLGERGIRMTRPAEPRECLDLLGGRRWRFLIVDAGDDVPGSLDVLSRARGMCRDVPALVLVRRGDVKTAVQAMKAGAFDCVETPIRPACLLAAIAPFCGPPDRTSEELWVHLTRVEQTVLWHILDGRTNRQIADQLCRSPRTVEVHRKHVMAKLNAGNLIELVRHAMRAGMIGVGNGGESCD
jgi:two-component system response regulator FixJ